MHHTGDLRRLLRYVITDGAGGSDTGTVLVPEPSRFALLAAGVALVLLLGRRRARR